MRISTILPLFTFIIATGCAYQPTPTSDSYPFTVKSRVENLVIQASAELECPAEQLTLKSLKSWARIQVLGCGAKVSYQYVDGVGYVLDVVTSPAGQQ